MLNSLQGLQDLHSSPYVLVFYMLTASRVISLVFEFFYEIKIVTGRFPNPGDIAL